MKIKAIVVSMQEQAVTYIGILLKTGLGLNRKILAFCNTVRSCTKHYLSEQYLCSFSNWCQDSENTAQRYETSVDHVNQCLISAFLSSSGLSESSATLQIKSMIYLHCFITPVHQISVVMLNLEVKRKSKNNHLEKDKLPISGLVFRQSLKALEKMRPPASRAAGP